jgi:hypothetical protein
MAALDRIEHVVGKVLRYDGKTCVWTVTGVFDVRDIVRKIVPTITLGQAIDALEENAAEDHKRIKAERLAEREASI